MKQQSITSAEIKDLFGLSGNEFQEIKEAISGFAIGETHHKRLHCHHIRYGLKVQKDKNESKILVRKKLLYYITSYIVVCVKVFF